MPIADQHADIAKRLKEIQAAEQREPFADGGVVAPGLVYLVGEAVMPIAYAVVRIPAS